MNTHLAGRLIGVCFVFVFVRTSPADDWPQWLGPQRDSVWRETGIVEKLPASGPVVKWRAPVAGGYAGPAVAAGRVYVIDYSASGDRTPDPNSRSQLQGQERVHCFSAADGQPLWKHQYDCSYGISFPAGPRCTPTVDGDRVYTLGAEGDLRCLKTDDGSLIWSHNFKRDYQAETPMWGYCGHPLVDGDRLFCVVGGEGSIAVAFDKLTGKELWRALSAKEQAYCPPTMIEAGGKRQLLIWHAEAINGLDPETGRADWSVPLDANYAMGIATPRQLGQYLFAGGIVNKSVLLKLGTDQPTAEVAWRGAKGKGLGPVMVTPFLEGDYMYGVDGKGELRCVKLATGEPLWTTYAATAPTGRPTHSACAFLVKHGDRFFLPSETGELIVARLKPEKYDEICRAKIIEPTGVAFGRNVWWSHPAFAQRCIFARNDKELVCLSLAAEGRPDDEQLWSEAEARIERHRKADATVLVTDAAGTPVEGAEVRIEQTQHAFLFGCNIFAWGRVGDEASETAYRQRFAEVFNFATLPFYWWSYEPQRGQPSHEQTEQVARWCQQQGIVCKGHPLAWNYAEPRWLTEDTSQVLELQLARVGDCLRRFGGLVDRWDVVNEATHFDRADCKARAPRLTAAWAATGQIEFVRRCFQEARQADPQATLLINDYRVDPPYVQLIEKLVDENGKPLYDAIGIQSHQHGGVWSNRKVWDTCERFARFGVPLHFTETTILSGQQGWERAQRGEDWPSTPEGEATQAREVERFYTMLYSHPAVAAITWWDFSDRAAWQRAPAGFLRKDMSPKPAYDVLHRLIKEKWWTRTTLRTDAKGKAAFRGTLGQYRIIVTASGRTAEPQTLDLHCGEANQLTVRTAR